MLKKLPFKSRLGLAQQYKLRLLDPKSEPAHTDYAYQLDLVRSVDYLKASL